MKGVPSERSDQILVVSWLRRHGIPHHHSPNGGRRALTEALAFKAMGTSAGFPDLLVFLPSGPVALELKRERGGRTSPEQETWMERVRNVGWKARACHGAQEAIAWLEECM